MRRNTKALIGLAALLGGGVLAVRHWQEDIGLALFERGVEARLARNPIETLPDGLHVALCGTGSPLPSADRAGACTVIIAGKRMMVVDAGEGGARTINLMGLPPGRIDRLFLTHFHSDHIDGLGPMMLLRWTGSTAQAPLPVHGPKGVETVIAGFNMAYSADNAARTAHHGAAITPPQGAGATPIAFDAEAGPVTIFEADGLTVTAFAVDHDPVRPAVGYRFAYKGRSVVISGDTAKDPRVAAAAKSTDLLVHEALQPKLVALMTKGLDAYKQPNTAQLTRDILDYHTSPEDAAEIAKAAGASMLVLSHIVPPVPSRFFYPALLGDAAQRFSGDIVVGEDGMLFSLPAANKTITQSRLN